MEINIVCIKRQLVHTTTFTMRSKHEKYTKHTNITSNSDLCTYDRLKTNNSTYELTFAHLQWLKSHNTKHVRPKVERIINYCNARHLSQQLDYWIKCSTYIRTKLHKTLEAEDKKIHNFHTYGTHLW